MTTYIYMGLLLAPRCIFDIQQTDNAEWTHKSKIQSLN